MFSELDPVMLARVQFGANITFHILFPTISISLAWVLLFFAAFQQDRRRALDGRLPLLGQGLRADLRARCGQRHHHELPVRHQLARLHGDGRQYRRSVAGL